jgi:hypothetical protein
MAVTGGLALINAITAGATQLATDQVTLATLEASVTNQEDAIANDTGANTTANAALSSFLQANGPQFTSNSDGSVSVYVYSVNSPGFTIVAANPAS